MTWRNKNNDFVFTIKTTTGRDQIEQITTKNFSQNAYLDKVHMESLYKRKLGISLLYLF